MKTLDAIVTILLIIGGLNWGLVGFFDFNLVAAIFGEGSGFSRFIYAVVGLCALYDLFGFRAIKNRWCATTPATHPR